MELHKSIPMVHEFYGSWHISKGHGNDDLPEAV